MPPAWNLLHREEGIDLRLPPAARTIVLVEEVAPKSAEFKPPAVGSISMKSGLNVDVCPQGRALIQTNTQHRSHLSQLMGIEDESNQVT